MKTLFLVVIVFFMSCEGWYGMPVPLGDEFEDHWYVLDSLQEQVTYLCASNIEPDCFFAMSWNLIWQVTDTPVEIAHAENEFTCIAASFLLPEQLVAGTASAAAVLIDGSGGTHAIALPGVDQVSHVAFDPLDNDVIYAGDNNLILRLDSSGVDFDTVFNSADYICNFIVSGSGSFYIATQHNVFLSPDHGITWDTIYAAAGAPISHITLDQQENLYAICSNAIYRTSDKINWTSFYQDSILWEFTTGTADGLIIARQYNGRIDARKITGSGHCYDISHGLVAPFGLPSILCASNGSKYLLSNSHLEQLKAILFYFKDTDLPP